MITDTFIRRIPKAELHLHIEGSFEPELMFQMAQRNNVTIPYATVEELKEAYNFSQLQDFLDIYYQGMSVLLTQQDYYDLTMAYLRKAHEDGVIHTEIFFDPQGHTERGVAFETVVTGIDQALQDAKTEFGLTSRLIMCFLRHLSEEDALATWEEAQPFLDKIHGIGLDSSEVGHPPSKFKRVYDLARTAGLPTVAHAGEEGPPSYVWEALDDLKIDRIDHGNRALEDENLVTRIKQDGLALTVCPLSNLKLCVVDDMAQHPIRAMLDKGLKATVNSDDPAYFGGYVGDNFISLRDHINLTQDELILLCRNSLEAAFVPQDHKANMIAQLDKFISENV